MVREGRDPFNTLAVSPNKMLLRAANAALLCDSLKTNAIGRIIAQDPVMLLELCKTVYSSAYARADSLNLLPPGQMITLIGVQAVAALFRNLNDRPVPDSLELSQCLENARLQCLRLSGIARIIGNAVDPILGEQCSLIGLFARFGDLIAAIYLENDFVVAVNEESSRAKLAYRLAKRHAFDLEKSSIRYLSLHGLPEKVLACIDRDSQITSSDLINRKLVVMSSKEVLAAYEEAKWDRYAPNKALPVRSFLRPLKFLGMGYEKLYDDLSSYLNEPIAFNTAGLEDEDNVKAVAEKEVPNLRLRTTISGRIIAEDAEELDSNEPMDMSLSFLGKFNPHVLACIRGIRKAESLFAAGQQASLREAVFRLLSPLLNSSPDWESVLQNAANAYYPLTFLDFEKSGTLQQLIETLSPREINAIIALSYFYGEFERHCGLKDWELLQEDLFLEIEIGRIVGSLFEAVGPGNGMLLAGVRRLSLGVILFHDPQGFRKYMEHLKRSSRPFDLVYERTKWNREHLSFCGPILHGIGFGIEMTRAFEGFANIPQITDLKARLCAIVPHWVESIRETGRVSATPKLLKQFGVGKDEVLRLEAEVNRLMNNRPHDSWLKAIKEDITD